MANYATLKAAITAVIKQNGNNEITGALLQQALLSMIDSLGENYDFAGVATTSTNPGTPDQNVFYIAYAAGTYANFGGLTCDGKEINIFRSDPGGWVKLSPKIANFEYLMAALSACFMSTTGEFTIDQTEKTVSVASSVGWEFYVFMFGISGGVQNVSPHSFSFADPNQLYVYYDANTKQFNTVRYDLVGTLTNKQIVCGYIDAFPANNRPVFIGGKQVGTLPFTQQDKDNIGDGAVERAVAPTGWDSKVWNNTADSGTEWFNINCYCNPQRTLNAIHIYARVAGTFTIKLRRMSDFGYFYGWDVTCQVGDNTIPISGFDYDTPFYVTVTGKSGAAMGTIYPAQQLNPDCYTVVNNSMVFSGYEVGYWLDINDYGNLLVNRVAHLEQIVGGSSSSDINLMLAQSDDVKLEPRDYLITTPVVLSSGKKLHGSFGKTRLILSNGCTTAISGTDCNDIEISGLEIVGTQVNYRYEMNGIVAGDGYDLVETEADAIALNYMGSEIGIHLIRCENVLLNDLKINHITGSAIRCNHVGMNYTKGLNSTNVFITNCYNGIYCENEHEFSQYTNFTITVCMIGLYVASGNLIFTAGHVTRCRVGIQYVEGYNHAHGICNGLEVKHNQIAGILFHNCTYGQFVQGIFLQYSNIIIRNSTDVVFDAVNIGPGKVICTNDDSSITTNNRIGFLFKRQGATVENTGNLIITNEY